MKRINDNYEKDGLNVEYTKYHIKIEKVINGHILFKLTIGEANLTFEQANEMLKPFGIIIEPKKIADWSTVEVGRELSIKSEKNSHPLYGHARPKITFKEWIEQTNQIIVFNGNKVEVYNEDEVELL